MLPNLILSLVDQFDLDVANVNLKAIAIVAAVVAVLGCTITAIGQGKATAKAVEGVSRNPESAGKVRSTLIVGCALVETSGIYCLIVSILILFFVVV